MINIKRCCCVFVFCESLAPSLSGREVSSAHKDYGPLFLILSEGLKEKWEEKDSLTKWFSVSWSGYLLTPLLVPLWWHDPTLGTLLFTPTPIPGTGHLSPATYPAPHRPTHREGWAVLGLRLSSAHRSPSSHSQVEDGQKDRWIRSEDRPGPGGTRCLGMGSVGKLHRGSWAKKHS